MGILDNKSSAREKAEALEQEKLRLKAEEKRRRREAKIECVLRIISFILPLLPSLVVGGFALYAYFAMEAILLFKVMFWLEIVIALFSIVVLLIHYESSAALIVFKVLTLCLFVAHVVLIIFMASSGRLRFMAIVTDENGTVYVETKNGYYIHEVETDVETLVISELPYNVIGVRNEVFQDHASLSSLVIDSPKFSVGKRAFSGCTALSSITFGDGDYDLKDNAFSGCTALTALTFGDADFVFHDTVFQDNKNLTSVTFRAGNYQFNGKDLFSHCHKLTDIYLESGRYSGKSKILGGLGRITVHHKKAELDVKLEGASELTLLVYPGTTSIFEVVPDVLVFAEGFTFENWTGTSRLHTYAKKMYFPISVTKLPEGIFGYADNDIGDAYYQGSEEEWANVVIPGLNPNFWGFGDNSNSSYIAGKIQMHYNSTSKYWESTGEEAEGGE